MPVRRGEHQPRPAHSTARIRPRSAHWRPTHRGARSRRTHSPRRGRGVRRTRQASLRQPSWRRAAGGEA
ncbi:hypothetical protein ACFPRL_23955 [Pseudoclavibacter helvolus]